MRGDGAICATARRFPPAGASTDAAANIHRAIQAALRPSSHTETCLIASKSTPGPASSSKAGPTEAKGDCIFAGSRPLQNLCTPAGGLSQPERAKSAGRRRCSRVPGLSTALISVQQAPISQRDHRNNDRMCLWIQRNEALLAP